MNQKNKMRRKIDMFRLFFLFLGFCLFINLHGQAKNDSTLRKNSIFIEFLGSSVYVYNVTFDRIFWERNNNKFTASMGAQLFPKLGLLDKNLITLSPQLNYLWGKNHNLELGIGIAYDLSFNQSGVPLRIGYRYQPKHKKIFIRVGYTPILSKYFPTEGSNLTFHHWGGFGIGVTL